MKKWERRGQRRQTRWSEHENQGENIDVYMCVCVCSRNVDGGRRGKVRMTEARGTETARHGGAFGGRKGMEKWRRRKKKRERGMGREGERDSGKEWNAVRGERWR